MINSENGLNRYFELESLCKACGITEDVDKVPLTVGFMIDLAFKAYEKGMEDGIKMKDLTNCTEYCSLYSACLKVYGPEINGKCPFNCERKNNGNKHKSRDNKKE